MRIPNPKGIESPYPHKGDHSNIKNFAGHSKDGKKHLAKLTTEGARPIGGTVYPGGHGLVKGVYDIGKKVYKYFTD